MKISKAQVLEFQKKLLEFYGQNLSDKPWNKDKNPYKIWLFEVVMQQTRMEQGRPYYERLIKKFPTIESLAKADEDDLFAVWKGLGYYSRARNLHFTADYILNKLNGKFPNTYADLLKLKGVGEYTAAAIASFAYGEDLAVLDGNVHRILSRYFGINKTIQSNMDKNYFRSIANKLLVKKKSAQFNQAMMDMGSQICKPQNPKCEDCVFLNECKAYLQNRILELPPPKSRPVLKDRYFYNLFIEYKGKIYLEKRTANDIWKGLYQGVVQEGKEIDEKFWKEKGIDISNVVWSEWKKQVLSHQQVFMRFGRIKLGITNNLTSQLMDKKKLSKLAFPAVVNRYIELFKQV